MVATATMVKNIRANTSGEPNSKATLANWGAASKKTMAPKVPPRNEANIACPSALCGNPCLVISYPSSTVAAASGAPGVRKSTAVMEPENTAVA